MKKFVKLMMSSLLVGALLVGCGKTPATTQNSEVSQNLETSQNSSSQPNEIEEEATTIRISALSGPTAMGMVKLMKDSSNKETKNTYEFGELSTDPSAFVAAITKGELDICAVPSNLAANLYNKTNGQILVLAANVYGVVSIVERGENSLHSFSDLKGHTIYATGQGAVPEYTLRNLLDKNGLDSDSDVDIRWCSDTTEALSMIQNDANAIAMLPQPFVTAAMGQVSDLRIAFDLNDEWAKVNTDCKIITGCLVVRKDFAEKYPNQLKTFIEEYQASVDFSLNNVDKAAELIAEAGIVKAAPLAKKALPSCNLTCLTGKDLRDTLSAYLQIIYDYNPKAVGEALPGEDFYYEAK